MQDQRELIYQHISQSTRNHLVFCREVIPSLTFINVGKELAEMLAHEDLNSPMVSYAADDAFSDMLSQKYDDNVIGSYLALANIGILFEQELGFNIRKTFEAESRNRTLIICSLGEIKNNHYYFYSEGDGVDIDLTGLPYLVM